MRIRCPQTLLHGVVLMCMHLAPLRRHPICMVALIRSNLARCPQTLLHGVVLMCIRLAPLRRHPICMAFIRSNLARCPHTLLHGVVLMCIRLAPLRRRSICMVAFIRSNLARCPHTLLHGVVLSFLVFMLVPVCLRHQRFVHCHRDHRRPAAAAAAAAASQSARTRTIAAAQRIAAASAAVAVVAVVASKCTRGFTRGRKVILLFGCDLPRDGKRCNPGRVSGYWDCCSCEPAICAVVCRRRGTPSLFRLSES